ncbi:MAG: hypothetical protein XU15_C0008G0078 [candidate division NC10 bacterium CSP1-5]|nr:MAG: hypothetical protein XU15_C0008G0078 [candidate division NC10 bacterium CSP1-5]
MLVEENIRVTEEHLEAEANRELARLLGTLADDSVYEESLLEAPVRGKAAIAGYYRELWKGFPDFSYIVTNRVADDSCVIYEMTFRGTHTGTFRGIPPTGRSGEIKGVVVFPMKNGKALGERIYLDSFSLLTQLGVLPKPESLSGRLLFSLLRLRLSITSFFRRT